MFDGRRKALATKEIFFANGPRPRIASRREFKVRAFRVLRLRVAEFKFLFNVRIRDRNVLVLAA